MTVVTRVEYAHANEPGRVCFQMFHLLVPTLQEVASNAG